MAINMSSEEGEAKGEGGGGGLKEGEKGRYI